MSLKRVGDGRDAYDNEHASKIGRVEICQTETIAQTSKDALRILGQSITRASDLKTFLFQCQQVNTEEQVEIILEILKRLQSNVQGQNLRQIFTLADPTLHLDHRLKIGIVKLSLAVEGEFPSITSRLIQALGIQDSESHFDIAHFATSKLSVNKLSDLCALLNLTFDQKTEILFQFERVRIINSYFDSMRSSSLGDDVHRYNQFM